MRSDHIQCFVSQHMYLSFIPSMREPSYGFKKGVIRSHLLCLLYGELIVKKKEWKQGNSLRIITVVQVIAKMA